MNVGLDCDGKHLQIFLETAADGFLVRAVVDKIHASGFDVGWHERSGEFVVLIPLTKLPKDEAK